MVKTAEPKADFLRWYQPLHDKLSRYCSSRAFGVMDPEDLIQEAVLATLKNWNRIQQRDHLLSYMIGVVNNLIRNHRRRAPFRGTLEESRLELLQSRLGDAETALDVHFLLKAIDQLPAAHAEALQLFQVSGFSVRE
ncbi:MAG: sigma-70 family RNA polymerase sigma factor, partial [Bacteroidota bacterium]